MQNIVKITSIIPVTRDVLRIVTEKPKGHYFIPGQATEVAIKKEEWKAEKRPFTFTNLPEDEYLEFTIKTYPEHEGVTNELLQLKPGDELILGEVFGTISYQGEGVFIAGGAGVTPFISIFRQLRARRDVGNNQLIFANKTRSDIINEQELRSLLGNNFINILSQEKTDDYAHGHITADFLKSNFENFAQKFYVCGPPAFMEAVEKLLADMGVDESLIVKEDE